jgi:hypothetical protein
VEPGPGTRGDEAANTFGELMELVRVFGFVEDPGVAETDSNFALLR